MENEQIKKTILIVEDNQPVLKVLADKLTREGFMIFQAKNGEEGLMVANEKHPDLILLDIIMPLMDGLTMMKKLREGSEWGKNALVIMLTNLSPEEENIVKSIHDHKPVDYLIKSNWSIKEVLAKVRDVLKKV